MKKPGARAFTRTPAWEKCTASQRVKLLTAAFAVAGLLGVLIARARLRPEDVSDVFLTHVHPDHCGDLPALLFLFRYDVKPRAARLRAAPGIGAPLGTMDIAFYRDDYHQQGLQRDPKRTRIPFDVGGRDLLLVDDVLYTGRTVRAAMNELFDYGRPASISLVVLADRGGRELPICPQYCGCTIEVAKGTRLRLLRDDCGKLKLALQHAE